METNLTTNMTLKEALSSAYLMINSNCHTAIEQKDSVLKALEHELQKLNALTKLWDEMKDTPNLVMTKAQAEIAMQNGEKVTHRFFEPHEYYCIKDHNIHDESGMSHGSLCGIHWTLKSSPEWQTDWKLFSEKAL